MLVAPRTIFVFTFRLICYSLFLYSLYNVIEAYLQEKTVTKISKSSQNSYPRPQFCFGVEDLSFYKGPMNRTFDEYIFEGKWGLEEKNLNADEFYEELTPDLTDLIDNLQIEVQVEGIE